MGAYRNGTLALAFLTLALGIALLVATVAQGGGSLGIVLGFLFIVAGGGRLYVLRRFRGGRP
jgi:hypothetical protein